MSPSAIDLEVPVEKIEEEHRGGEDDELRGTGEVDYGHRILYILFQ